MSEIERIRRQRILREAEGYLDLLMVFAEQWPPEPQTRDRLAQRALDALERLPDKQQQRQQVLYLRGQALRCMERYGEAAKPLQAAAEQDPENIHIWLALAWCHKRIGRIDLAIQDLEEALAADSSEALIHYNLACYWSLARNSRHAIRYLSRAFDLDSNYRDLVHTEADFDPIRDLPEFQALASVIV